MLITFTGRKSGKVYTTPVEYRRVENTVIFSSQRNRVWWKNLQDNAGVTLRIKGRKVEGMVEQLVFDEKEAAKEFKVIYPRLSDERAAKFAANALIVKVGIGG
jgi:deazaflavin-dependent oxidoreductase (nitroreductase family)